MNSWSHLSKYHRHRKLTDDWYRVQTHSINVEEITTDMMDSDVNMPSVTTSDTTVG